MKLLVTGAAGFIGYHVCRALLDRGDAVLGFDNLNDYYDVSLKEARLGLLERLPGFCFRRVDLSDRAAVESVFEAGPFDVVCHLGAQAGVRYSIENPLVYGQANLVGFLHVLEGCRRQGSGRLVYASSSSVYGANEKIPFSEADRVDRPVSLYAATKLANEAMAHAYHHLYGFAVTGLRFFTVYGPWGRPDMALFTFTRKILAGEPIDVYNHGRMGRDFTYVDDVAAGVLAAIDRPLGCEVLNLGNSRAVDLERFIDVLEGALGVAAVRRYLPLQPGDVPSTRADVARAKERLGWEPTTPIEEGIPSFVAWYRSFYETTGC